MDEIIIRRLRAQTHIGFSDEERARPQAVRVDIAIAADLARAGRSDDLGDTVDYHGVVTRVTDFVASSEVNLLEHLAEKIAGLIARDFAVQRVTVEVAKESPPFAEAVDEVAVRIERPRR